MKAIKKQHLIWASITLCGLAFVFPFIIMTCEDTISSILLLSFTAVGTVATIATLVIAIFLYDRFGLEGKFMEKQTEKVLELVDLIKGKTITVKVKNFNYLVRPSRKQLDALNKFTFYQRDCKKIILVSPDDYELALRKINAVRRSYWLPKKIKEKMIFLEIVGFATIENPQEEKYVRFDFHETIIENWMLAIPETTFEYFNNNLYDLVFEIENWLSNHSEIPIDLKLEEPHQDISNLPN